MCMPKLTSKSAQIHPIPSNSLQFHPFLEMAKKWPIWVGREILAGDPTHAYLCVRCGSDKMVGRDRSLRLLKIDFENNPMCLACVSRTKHLEDL